MKIHTCKKCKLPSAWPIDVEGEWMCPSCSCEEEAKAAASAEAKGGSLERIIRTYEPIMVAKPESDREALNEIADACQKLCDAVTARMSCDEPDGKKVWDMFKAHGHATDLLRHRPNSQMSEGGTPRVNKP